MSFVKDDGGVLRQQARVFHLLQGEVGKKEMVVHNQDVRLGRPLMHPGDEATLELVTLLSGTGLAARVDA